MLPAATDAVFAQEEASFEKIVSLRRPAAVRPLSLPEVKTERKREREREMISLA